MAQTTVNIRMDEATKVAFDRFCREIGLSASAAFNIFAKTVVREQRIPFALTTEVPNEETKRAMDNVKQGKNLSRGFHTVSELMEDLYADNPV